MNSWLSLRVKLHDRLLDLGLLGLRLWLAQEFLTAGWLKLGGGLHAPAWFAGLAFPFPQTLLPADVNWTLAGCTEVLLGLALLIGCQARLAAAGLLYVTWVAIYSVHSDLGWNGWNQIDTDAGQGFKVPLMIAVMLFAILTQGAGRYALSALFQHRRTGNLLPDTT